MNVGMKPGDFEEGRGLRTLNRASHMLVVFVLKYENLSKQQITIPWPVIACLNASTG